MMEELRNTVKVIAFDADDTLWENEPLFREAERKWAEEMKEYGTLESLSAELYATEAKNMEELGYGAKPYLISVLETSVRLAGDRLTGSMVGRILAAGREILQNPATPLPGVRDALEQNRELAEELAAAFNRAREAVQAFFADLSKLSLQNWNGSYARVTEQQEGINGFSRRCF